MLSVVRTHPHNLANRGISASVANIWYDLNYKDMELEELRNKYTFVPEGDVLLELSSVFGEAKASQMYKEAIQSDGIKMFRKGLVSHEISVSHCGNCVSYKRVVNPWYLSMIKDVDSLLNYPLF